MGSGCVEEVVLSIAVSSEEIKTEKCLLNLILRYHWSLYLDQAISTRISQQSGGVGDGYSGERTGRVRRLLLQEV